MRYFVLACDYDGTLALNGQVSEEITAALKRVRESGRKLILVTGRELDHLQEIYSHLELFDWVVAENGAKAAGRLLLERFTIVEFRSNC